MNIPNVGDVIYVPSSFYIGHDDDIKGGKIVINSIEEDVSANNLVHFVASDKIDCAWNWEHFLAPIQDKLKNEYGDNWAFDMSTLE